MIKLAMLLYTVSFCCALYFFWPKLVKIEAFHGIISTVLSPELQVKILAFRHGERPDLTKVLDKIDDSHPGARKMMNDSVAPPPPSAPAMESGNSPHPADQL
jgi:hypothetical protein